MYKKIRYYDVDWLRVLGMLTIFFFHVARFFNEEGWHVKNFELSFGVSVFVSILANFIMPLFFVLSAFSIFYALKKRTNTQFIGERATRLLIPLFVGIFTHIILQVYIENITQGRFVGSFWAFLPEYFNGWYAFGGNFAWMGLHLWYLLMLFIFSGLMLPVFRLINCSQNFTEKLASMITKPFGVYLFTVPLFLMELLVSFFPESVGRRDFGGWSPLTYIVFFLIGHILATDERYRPAIEKVRFISLALSLLSLLAGYFLLVELQLSSISLAYLVVRSVNSWAWLLTFLGFAARHLNTNNAFLKYANEAVLPFYILHQTVIVILGYFIKEWPLAVFPKYLLLASVSFLIIMALYEFIVKRVKVIRFLFGMKA